MLIKLLYIVFIFFGVRLLYKIFSAPKKPVNKSSNDDYINAEYKVVDEDEN